MKILVIGSGGREHALCWRIKQSPLMTQVFCAPGNAGTALDVTNVAISKDVDIIAFCQKESIALVVIGPEAPLVEGLADTLARYNIPVFGPSAKAAQLEGSKGFTKDLCEKYNIPTAAYGRFADAAKAKDYIRKHGAPIVVKADGLAAGKGVVVAMNEAEALDAVDEMFSGRFGEAGASVVIEEFMEGEEVSFFALTDGKNAIEFGSAQDHKRVGDGDTGPNTGGMGTYAPAPVMSEALRKQVMDTIILPTVAAMAKEGHPYKGVLFAGLMLTKAGPKLLEYNARFGDPETQVLMMRLKSDLVPVLMACATGNVSEVEVAFVSDAAVCVVMAAQGYPGTVVKGTVISGLEKAANISGVKVFHAGTESSDGHIIAAGGRVLGVTALAPSFADARKNAYAAVDAIDWPQGFCRRDIGARVCDAMRKGFTLLEISVVLVIIALLTSGIVVAQSLIRTSKVQTVITDVATYQNAIVQFKQKYNALPGDMPNAQTGWGINPNCATGGAGTGTQTCNGAGNGQITLSASAPYEQFLAWQHLANAKLIAGQYTGSAISGATAPTLYCSSGVNCPGGKISQQQAYFIQYSTGALGSTTNYWAQAAGHYLIVGANGGANTGGYPAYPLFTASEAASLDAKVDDGLPGMGTWKSFEATGGAGYLPKCVVTSGTNMAPTDGTLASEPGSAYYVAYSSSAPACSFEINLNF